MFLFAYAVDTDLKMSPGEAVMLNMSYRASGAIGVLLSTLLSRFLPIQVTGFSFLILNAICSLCLALLGPTNKILFWVFACLIGLFSMQLWGCVTAWYGRYTVVYSTHLALFIVCFSLGIIFFVWLGGGGGGGVGKPPHPPPPQSEVPPGRAQANDYNKKTVRLFA